MRRVAALFILFVFFSSGAVHAQSTNASLTGQVVDQSKSVIPDSKVTLTNKGTNLKYSGTTNQDGIYYVRDLPPGEYRMEVEKVGFKSVIKPDITLHVQDALQINFEMALGSVSESITVPEGSPPLQVTTSAISSVADAITVRELPLNGRDWTQLAALQPGVASVASLQLDASVAGFSRGSRGFGVQMTVDGSRPQQNSYLIDGINVNDYTNGGPGSVVDGVTLGVDAIQEFSVITANYSAEYGRTSGGVITAATRSGTNSFHGDAFEFVRNSVLDAANFFDNFTGTPKPPFSRNQFGGSAGGPIAKNRIFIFGDYEGIRQNQGLTTLADVPSMDARNGTIHNSDGTTTTITIDPKVAPYLPLWHTPNAGILPPGNTGIYSFVAQDVASENFGTLRLDYNISQKDNLFGTYQYDHGTLVLPDALNTVNTPQSTGRQLVTINETHLFNPQVINSIRFGYSRTYGIGGTGNTAINPLALDTSLGAIPGEGPPEIDVGSLTSFAPVIAVIRQFNNSFQVYDDLSVTKGRHDLKFGFSAERIQLNGFQATHLVGQFKFGSLTSFLTNEPSKFAAAIPGLATGRGFRQSIFGGYVQDNFRLRPNLTLNLGLRYEMSTVPTEVNDKLTTLRDPFTDTMPHLGNPLFHNPTLHDFEPRLGFAWTPFHDGKTVIRSAFGMFDSLPLLYEVWIMQVNAAPFAEQGSVSHLMQGSFPDEAFPLLGAPSTLRNSFVQGSPNRNYVMTWNLNVQHEIAPNLTAMVAYVGSRGVHQPFRADDMNDVLPTLTSAGFLWPSPIGSGTVLNPNVGRIDTIQWTNNSSYNALQAQITKRFSHGFQVQGSYTWGRSIDEGSASIVGDPFANSISSLFFFAPQYRRGPSDFNVTNNLAINYTWYLPNREHGHAWATWAASGWQIGGIVSARSGLPFTPLLGGGGDPLGLNNADPFDFPDRLRGPGCQSQANPGNVNYLKLNCFALPLATPAIAAQCVPFQPGGPPNPVLPATCSNLLGNGGRNEITGPGLIEFDFALMKNNSIKRISENFNVQFRVETFNLFNHPNFNSPIDNASLFDQTGAPIAGAGMIDSTSTSAREIQFGIKMIW
jgi:hypothetical protein